MLAATVSHCGRGGVISSVLLLSRRCFADHAKLRAAGRTATVATAKMSTAGVEDGRVASAFLGVIRRGDEQPSVTTPTSPQTYFYRLRHGRFDSLTTLMSAPYAASPLRIVADVLGEVALLKKCLASGEITDDADRTFGENGAWQALAQMTRALSDSLTVRHVLLKAINGVKEAAEAASVMGDYHSECELQKELQEINYFAEQLQQCNIANVSNSACYIDAASLNMAPDESYQRLLSWSLPEVVMGEILHALLELCSITGDFKLAVTSLEQLIELSELVERVDARKKLLGTGVKDCISSNKKEEGKFESFTLDSVVETVEEEARCAFAPVSALDHIRAIRSCELTRKFDIAYSLFQRYMQHATCGVFPLTASDIEAALVALSRCCDNTAHFAMLHELFIASEAASVVAVSVELYTALIDAVSRASENPKRMAIALAFYRRLRDGGFSPTSETYAALMRCCASVKEPTHAFAFYHEARHQCGVDNLTPSIYSSLLLSYAAGGYGADARKTLEVLVEAGAPLTRSAFHAALSAAVTVRDAEEMLTLMQTKYRITPTPQTYAYLVWAAGTRPAGASTVLQMFDWHELALQGMRKFSSFVQPHTIQSPVSPGDSEHNVNCSALSQSPAAAVLEDDILARYPAYAEAVGWALMRLRVDLTPGSQIEPYIRPLLRVAQRRMNAFTEMAPQAPTRVPKGAAIAVLAADVLANIEEWFMPFVSHYSAVVIPYSSFMTLQRGGGRRRDTSFEKGPQYLLNDPAWQEMGSEKQLMLESRRRVLVKFLQNYSDVIHHVSLGEELAVSRDCGRYGIGVKNTFARCAAFALNLARADVSNVTRVYAEQKCNIVLVSANFDKCGRYVVDLKREFGQGKKIADGFQGLADAVQRVWYHNPHTSPHWQPPQVSLVSLVDPAVKNIIACEKK